MKNLTIKAREKLKKYGLSTELANEYISKTCVSYKEMEDMSMDELEEDILCYLSPDQWYYKYHKCRGEV